MAQSPNSWVKKADFGGLKRERAVAFTANGFGYVGTGVDTAEIVHNDFWKYDASNDTWAQVADMPGIVRRDAVAFAINEIGYVTTGINAVTSSEIGANKLADTWRYDPVLNSWTAAADFPGNGGQGIYFAAAFVVEGKGYVVGGKQGPNNYSSQTYRYDPTLDQWAIVAPFPGGVRYQLSAFAVDNKGYAGLGTDQDMYRYDWWEYKPSTNTWAQRADLPASSRSNAATFTIGSRGFVCTGSNGGVLGDLWEYNPFSNSWSVRATYGGTARKSAIAFVIGTSAYVGTGKGESGKKASMHQYYPMSTLGIDEMAFEVNVYPNPTSEKVFVKSDASIETLQLFDLNGRNVRSVKGQNHMTVADLSAGNYTLRIASNEAVIQKQLIIR